MNTLLPLVLLLISIGVGNVFKFSFFSPDIRVSVLDCSIALLTVYQVCLNWKNYSTTLRQQKWIVKPTLLFSTIGLTSLLLVGRQYGISVVLVGGMYLLRWLVYSLFFASIVQMVKREELGKWIVLCIAFFAVTGLGQYLLFPDIRSLQVSEWDAHYYRVVGTLLDPGFLGILLVMGMSFLLEHKPKFHKLLLTFTYAAFALTYSRSSYLAFVVAMGYLAWKKFGAKFFVKAVLLLALTIFILPRSSDGEGVKLERTSSIQARIDNWKNSLTIIAGRPVLGVGFNTYRYAQNEYGFLTDSKWLSSHAGAGADSSLLFVAATTGLVGLGIYVWYLGRLWAHPGLCVHLAALFVHSLFLNSLFYPFVLLWLALLMAYTQRLVPSESDSRTDQER